MFSRRKYHILAFVTICVIFLILRQGISLEQNEGHEQPVDSNAFNTHASGDIQIGSGKMEHHLPINCKINNEVRKNVGLPVQQQNVPCLVDEGKSEVYVPFSFVKKYFDIYGILSESKSPPTFTWSHSYSKVFPHFKNNVYDPGGTFLQFSSFDVENRPRVKCISAKENVPVTTQWDKKGYTYATQIAQYGLAHWSKMNSQASLGKTERLIWLDNGNETLHGAQWSGSSMTRVIRDKCLHFDQPATLNLEAGLLQGLPVVFFDLLVRETPTISLDLHSPDYGTYKVQYSAQTSSDIVKTGKTVVLSYTDSPIPEGQWLNFTRNVLNDLFKGISLDSASMASSMIKKKNWMVRKIVVYGVGCISNLGFAQSQHGKMFTHAADWLVKHQNAKTGAWHVEVPFNAKKTKYPGAAEMPPGWISAMGSAQAMSVLTRAYRHSGREAYLTTAIRALQPFNISVEKGGVVANFLDKVPWYEEYPTQPSSYVLNGFMYSLLGLYDLKQTLLETEEVPGRDPGLTRSEIFFRQGLSSLVKMTPLFDTGTGSTYDLRHFTMSPSPPKLARWDYHSTHINLMYVLSTVADDPEEKKALRQIADRWQGYMVGQKAEHN